MELRFASTVVCLSLALTALLLLLLFSCETKQETVVSQPKRIHEQEQEKEQLKLVKKKKKKTRDVNGSGEDGQSKSNKTSRRQHLRVVTLEAPPFMMKRNSLAPQQANLIDQAAQDANSTDPSVVWYGYCMDFFLELIKHLPYEVTYEIYEVPDGKFGAKIREMVPLMPETAANNATGAGSGGQSSGAPSGDGGGGGGQNATSPPPAPARPVTMMKKVEYWNGLIGELQRGRAEIALAPMAVMAEREIDIDFTVPFYDLVGIQILLKRPEVPQNWFKFLTVLDNDVWLSIGLAYFATSFMIYIFDRLSPYSHKNLTRIKRARNKQHSSSHQEAAAARHHDHNNLKQSSFIRSDLDQANGFKANMQTIANTPNGNSNSANNPNNKFFLSRSLVDATGNGPYALPIKTISGGGGGGGGVNSNALQAGDLSSLSSQQQLAGLLPVGIVDAHGNPLKRRRASQDYLMSLRSRFGFVSEARLNQAQSRGHIGTPDGNIDNNDDYDDVHDNDNSDNSSSDDSKPDFNLRDSLWFCITSLTPQGGGEAPQNLSGRVVAGAWWLFCFIVIASYTANLAAFLTVSRLDIPIESLDDLAKQYRIKYAPIDGTAERTYFERMAYIEEIFYNIWKNMSLNDSLSELERSKFAVWDYPISDKYTKIWSQIQEVQMPATFQDALDRVRASTLDDGFALLANANLVKYAVMTDCSLKAVGDEFSRKPMALGMRKGYNDELRNDVSYAILQLINRRFMEVLREKWWTNNPARVVCNSNDESEGISIENIGGVFIIILAGILLSFLVWAIERFLYTTKIDVSRELLHLNVVNVATQPIGQSGPNR